MNDLWDAMYRAAHAARQSFSKNRPLVLHEPFHGLGGARHVGKIGGVEIQLGNLSCDIDTQFAGYYKMLARTMSHPPTCGIDIMKIPLHDVDDAHGILYILSPPANC